MYPFSLNIISCIETDKSNNIQIHHSTVVPLTTRNQLLVSSPRCKLFSLAMHMTFLTISLQHQLLYLATKGVYTHYNSLCVCQENHNTSRLMDDGKFWAYLTRNILPCGFNKGDATFEKMTLDLRQVHRRVQGTTQYLNAHKHYLHACTALTTCYRNTHAHKISGCYSLQMVTPTQLVGNHVFQQVSAD